MKRNVEAALPWALIGAASLGMFACTSSGTTRAPFLIEMARDLSVSMPLVANLVSLTATAWGVSSAVAGWLSDVVGRRPVLVLSLLRAGGDDGRSGAGGLLFLGRRLGHRRRRLLRRLHRRGLCRAFRPRGRRPARPRAGLGDERPVADLAGRRADGRRGGLADRLARLAALRRRTLAGRHRQHGDNRGSRLGRPYARRWCAPRSGTPCRSA